MKEGVFDEILRLVASGYTIRNICLMEGFPAKRTVWQYMYENPDMKTRYYAAREAGADVLAEECIDIADDGSNDFMTVGSDDKQVIDHEAVARSKLRVSARQWYIGKIARNVFGERIDVTQRSVNATINPGDDPKKAADIYKEFISGAD